MKYYLIVPLIFIFSTISFSQKKEIKKVVSNKNNDLYVTVVFDKNYDKRKVEKTCKKLGYSIYRSKERYYNKYGKAAKAYSQIMIGKPDEIASYRSYLAEQRKIDTKQNLEKWMAGIAIVAGGIYAAKKGVDKTVEWIGKNTPSVPSSSYSTIDKNEEINKQHNEPNQNKCYKSIKKYGTNFHCGGKKQQSYEVICGNGKKKYYYYLPLSIGACNEGYTEWITLGVDRYLGKTKGEALINLCNCKN